MSSREENRSAFPPNSVAAIPEKNLPKPASLLARGAEFVADSILVSLATGVLLKILLPTFFANECAIFLDYAEQILSLFDASIQAAAQGKNVDVFSAEISALAEEASQDESMFDLFGAIFGISFGAALLYFLLTEHFLRGKTLGKKIFGIRTVTFGTTLPPFFVQTLSRSFWKALTLVPAGLLILIAVVINAHVVVFARRHRGWHDKLSRTEVISDTEK